MGNKVIGERIETRRKQLGLTLDDIAREIGVAKSTIQRYERGTIETIKLPVIEAIANIMAVNPAWLCGKTDDMEPEKKSNNNGTHKRKLHSVARLESADITPDMDQHIADYIDLLLREKERRERK